MQNDIKQKLQITADQLVESFRSIKPFETWRIKVDGVFIMTSSGKTVWKKINHAKSALRLHFDAVKYTLGRTKPKDICWTTFNEMYEEEYQTFLKERVEFIRID